MLDFASRAFSQVSAGIDALPELLEEAAQPFTNTSFDYESVVLLGLLCGPATVHRKKLQAPILKVARELAWAVKVQAGHQFLLEHDLRCLRAVFLSLLDDSSEEEVVDRLESKFHELCRDPLELPEAFQLAGTPDDPHERVRGLLAAAGNFYGKRRNVGWCKGMHALSMQIVSSPLSSYEVVAALIALVYDRSKFNAEELKAFACAMHLPVWFRSWRFQIAAANHPEALLDLRIKWTDNITKWMLTVCQDRRV